MKSGIAEERVSSLQKDFKTNKPEPMGLQSIGSADKKSDKRFYKLLEGLKKYFFYTRDANGEFTFVCPRVASLLNYSPEEFRLNWKSYLADNFGNEEGVQRFKASLQNRRPDSYEVDFLHKDGHRFWLEIFEFPVLDAKGQMVAVEGISCDITKRKQLEEDMRFSKERFREINEQSPIGIFQVDSDDNYIYTNTQWQVIAGRTLKEIMGATWWMVIHPEDQGKVFKAWAEAEGEEEEFAIECRVLRPNKGIRWVLLRTKFLFHDDGKITFGTVEDITDRKVAEAERESLHRKLVETSRKAGMSEVATGVLHNVGNILNSVTVAAAMLDKKVRQSRVTSLKRAMGLVKENGGDLVEFVTEHPRGKHLPQYLFELSDHLTDEQQTLLGDLKTLNESIEHIKQVVNMQQSFARVAYVAEIVSVTKLLSEAVHINTASFDRHHIEVVHEYGKIPEVTTDKHKLLQILINMVSNAKHALCDSGNLEHERKMTLRINEGENETIRIQVIDNGVGIPSGNLTRVFSHGFTTKKGGHGFGLHSSALAAKEMGGSLTAESGGPGKGSTFTLELPVTLETIDTKE